MNPDCRTAQNFCSRRCQLNNQAVRDRAAFSLFFNSLKNTHQTGTLLASLNLPGQWRSGRMSAR
jgi:hypothetical protein